MATYRKQPSARVQGTQGPKDASAYLKQLEDLLKRNTGQGLFVGQDTSSNIPMYLPGKVVNPTGLSETPSTQTYGNGMQQPAPVQRQAPMQDTGEVLGEQTTQPTIEEFLQQLEQVYNAPENQQGFGDPRIEFIASTVDGGSLMADGTIVYDDGTIREGDPNATAIASDVSGGIRYSDGSLRRPAPNAIRSVAGNRERIGYDDGSTRWGQYQYGQSTQPSAMEGGLEGLISGIFGQDRPITQEYGNYNPQLEPGSGYNLGTDIRTRDLQGASRNLKLPVGAQVVQVLRDDGTQWGDISGHQGYGNSVLVRLATGEMLRFSHLSQMANFQPGQTIEAGQVIGTPGTTGNTNGEHLDLEYYDRSGNRSNPAQFSGLTDPQGLRTPLPGQPAPGTRAPSGQEPMSSQQSTQQTANVPQVSYPGQTINENIIKPTVEAVKQAPQNVFNAATKTAAQLGQTLDQSKTLRDVTGGLGVGASELLQGNVPAAGREISNTIEKINPTPRIDTGLSELARGDLQGAKTNFLDTANRVGARLSKVPSQLASEIVKPAYADDGSQKSLPESIGQNLTGAANSVGQYAGSKVSQAGEGIKALGQSGISALENVFKPIQDTAKRAVGDVAGTATTDAQPGQFSSLMDTASSMANLAKNDVRDPFFKMGGSEMYKDFLKPNAQDLAGGALTLDLFNPEFYKDLGNISSVFGGSKDLGAATDKYIEFEKQKYKPMSKMGYEDGYDRGEIDNYNREVDKYNNELNNYFNSIRSSVSGSQSIFTPAPSGSAKNVFASASVPQMSMAPMQSKMTAPSFSSKFASPAPQMSMARPSAAPSIQAPRVSGGMSLSSGGVQGGMSVAPKPAAKPAPAPAPKVSGGMSLSSGKVQGGMSIAPKPQSQPAKSSGQQSKPSNNVFSKVTTALKNIFRR